MMNDAPQWLEECDSEDDQADNGMRVRVEVEMIGSLSHDPYAHPGCDEVDDVSNDLTCGVKLENDGRLDIETEEDCANGHHDNPGEGGKDCVNDDDMVDVFLSEA